MSVAQPQPSFCALLVRTFQQVEGAVQGQECAAQSGCSCSVVVVVLDRLYCATLGRSRVIAAKTEKSLHVWPLSVALERPSRGLSRAVKAFFGAGPSAHVAGQPLPDVHRMDITGRLSFVVMGTEGLWKALNAEEIATVVQSYRRAGDPKLALDFLLRRANERWDAVCLKALGNFRG